MTKKGIILGLIALAAAAGIWWLLRAERPGSTSEAGVVKTPVVAGSNTAAQAESPKVAPQTSPPKAASARSKQQRAEFLAALKRAADPAKKAQVVAALDDEKKLYNYAGALDWDDAKALIAKRQEATRDLEQRLAALGQGGASAMAATYDEADDIRGRMMLIQALGMIQDDQAGGLLEALLDTESSLSLQREIVAALGQRQDASSLDALIGILQNQADPQLRFAAALALAGRPDALPALSQLIQTESDPNVQKELILSIGAIGNDAALQVLAGIAQGSLDFNLRQTAIQALGRSGGAVALNTFNQLLGDPDAAIRQNVLRALAAMHSDAAVSLLQKAAASDSSAQVREQAQALLSGGPVQ